MATISVKVCDTCRDVSREAERWAVQAPGGGRVAVDLCKEHSAVLQAFMKEHKGEVRKPRKPAAGNKHHRPIHTIEEIEAMKAAKV